MPRNPSISFDDELRREYEELYASCALDEDRQQLVIRIANKICGHKARYDVVEAVSGVPWYVVGTLHCLECGLRFTRHLHNGDPIAEATVRAPRGRPPQPPPFTWEQSAADAIGYSGLARWRDWSLAGTLYRLEAYNGFGYRIHHPTVKTPYLWSFTSHYRKGRYGVDGKFDPELVSQQAGGAAILRALEELGHIRLSPPGTSAPGPPEAPPEGPHPIALAPVEQDDPLVARALAVAAGQIGVKEGLSSPNSGHEVTAYLEKVGLGAGHPWCAAFVYWCFDEAAREMGAENPLVKTGHCMTHWREARKQGVRSFSAAQAAEDPSLLRPGHVFIIHHGDGKGHTGLVESVRGDALVTIEGNTSSDGGRDGDGVYRRSERRIRSINVGFIDYAGFTPARTQPPPGEVDSEAAAGSIDLPQLPRPARWASARGLLCQAVDLCVFEPPQWIDVPFEGLFLSVGAHALRAHVGDRLLRLPVCYLDVITISNKLGWIPPTAALSDAIWRAATVRVRPVPLGDRSTPERSRETDRKLQTMELVEEMNRRLDAAIPPGRWGELACTEGKDWILSKRNLLPTRAGGSGLRGVANYGWHDPHSGIPLQPLQADDEKPPHDEHYFDYSQTLRPIRRIARTADGTEVDLLDVIEQLGIPAAVLAPFRGER